MTDLLKELAQVLPEEWRSESDDNGIWMTNGRDGGDIDRRCTDAQNARGWCLLLDLLESKGWTYSLSFEDESGASRYVLQLWHKATSEHRLADGSGSTRTEAIVRAVIAALGGQE